MTGPRPEDRPHPSDLTARFVALVRAPGPVPLDEASTVLAAHFRAGPDGDGTDGRAVSTALADLAGGVGEASLHGVVSHLTRVGWGGSPSDYGEVASSLLPEVLRRRRGLPISLAIVAVEVGRRVGVDLHVVGMPGHVLVGDGRALADPFHQRPHLGPDEARKLFHRMLGPDAEWDGSHLAPADGRSVVARVLANLANRLRADNRHRDEAVALGLRQLVPGVEGAERGALAVALARSGAFDRAARELESLAEDGGAGHDPDVLRARAERWRARLN